MAIDKIQSESINLADNFAFTGTVTGASGANTPYFSALKTGNQTITHSQDTKVSFGSEEIASSSGVFDVTNNKFTATVAGIYQFNFKATFYDSANNLKRADLYIFKNNSQVRKEIFFMANGGIREVCLTTSFIDTVSVNDYYEMYVYHNTTDNGTIAIAADAHGSAKETFFQAFKLI